MKQDLMTNQNSGANFCQNTPSFLLVSLSLKETVFSHLASDIVANIS